LKCQNNASTTHTATAFVNRKSFDVPSIFLYYIYFKIKFMASAMKITRVTVIEYGLFIPTPDRLTDYWSLFICK